ncbi:anthranilate phosphoribosyltransferase [Microaerobacter geothermalis]|uniref:anthranilate phosphoribosyltransferase n=1 Tax=Microaerobacter geothermalis TaxID=674972 RepID=UPI001F2D689F|nr:anthranilate phosphoribosyltransferase [Microaerobacter geothermalis]MCF6093744.1 anthranilate phosphoribosyltransferase [Microaerobacter geothermalis]
MQYYLREVGRGKKGAKDLTLQQAEDAAVKILTGEATEAQVGAFLLAERMKLESIDEILGFIRVFRKNAITIPLDIPFHLDCSGPYDGRGKSLAVTIPAALLCAAAGLPVVLHGAASLPPKYGVVLPDILEELGININKNMEDVKKDVRQLGIAYIQTENFVKPLHDLRKIRKELGVRTLLNTVEKLINLTHAPACIVGVFHNTAIEKTIGLLQLLGYKKGMVVQGIDGSEDIPTSRPSSISLFDGEKVEKMIIEPAEWGLDHVMPTGMIPASIQAQIIQSILLGEESPMRNMVILNTGLRLWFGEQANNLTSAMKMAEELLDSKVGWYKLKQWKGEQ